MISLWLQDQQPAVREVPNPALTGEALVRVRLAGVCATDLELVQGYYPFTGILGHEFVGEVVVSPDPAWIGRRVVGEINAACGQCSHCLAGRRTHCEKRTVLGIVNRPGVFAEYTSLPIANLHFVPDGIADEAAVFTEPLAAALEITQQVQIAPGDRVLVVGAGRLGQLVARVLALTACDLHVLARHDRQRRLLELAAIRPISDEQIHPAGWDIVVDATGSPGGFALARRAVRPRGLLVMKSTYKGDLTVNFSSLVVDEITLVGSRCGPFEPALRLLAEGRVDPRPLIEAEFPLAEGLAALDMAARPGVMKVLLRP